MKIDMNTGKKIAAWMQEKVKRFQCPVCQHLVWNVSEDIFTLTSDTGPFKPKAVFTLECASCASLTFFNAAPMGIAATPTKEPVMQAKNSAGDLDFDASLAEIQQQLQKHPSAWLTRIRNDPAEFAKLDQEIHEAFAQLADKMVASLKAATAGASGKK